MGLLNAEDRQGKWIGPANVTQPATGKPAASGAMPILRREFAVTKPVR